jgi:hypothetical protein
MLGGDDMADGARNSTRHQRHEVGRVASAGRAPPDRPACLSATACASPCAELQRGTADPRLTVAIGREQRSS